MGDGPVDALVALLHGLADGVGVQEFDARLEALLPEVSGDEPAARLVGAARRAYEAVQHRKQRESELGALYATARDLVALRDVDTTLEAVVKRAQQVLPGADTTYLCLKDDSTGGFYVLASVGLISPEFKHVIVPPGYGMSAEIERTRSALRVRRYAADQRIQHDRSLDDALSADGLTSVLGAPLIARDRVLGVLFAANRRERAFSDEETSLLTALADAAALAIDNARLFAEAQQARSDAEADNRALRSAAELHDRLTQLVIRGAAVTEVIDSLVEIFPGTLVLFDRRGRVLAHRGPTPPPDTPDEPLTTALADSRRSGRSVEVGDEDGGRRRAAAIAAASTYLGALVLHHDQPLSAMDIRNFERAAQIVTLLTLQQNAQVDAEEKVRGELLNELLTATSPVPEIVRLRAEARRLDLRDRLTVAAVKVDSAEKVGAVRRRLGDIAALDGGLAGDFGGLLALVAPSKDGPAALAADLHQRLSRESESHVLVCVSSEVDAQAGELPAAFAEAQQAVRLLSALGRTHAHATADELMLFGVLFDPARGERLGEFVRLTIGPLLDSDRDHGTDLVATLRTFFDCGANAARTARELFVHPNTVTKRLDRVAALLGPDWQLEHRSLAIRVAVRMHGLAGLR